MFTILIILAVLMLIGAIPAWPHSRSWGYGPSGGLGLILLIIPDPGTVRTHLGTPTQADERPISRWPHDNS